MSSACIRFSHPARRRHAWWAVLMLCLAMPVQAATYRVDMIVFLNNIDSGEQGRKPGSAPSAQGIDPADTAALSAAGIRIVPDADFALNDEWQRLRNSGAFRPLIRLAWTQNDPPAEPGPALAIRYGQPMAYQNMDSFESFDIQPVEGTVALLLGRYLHLDVDLRYAAMSGPDLVTYPLSERRRMRRDELHHLDSARLGVLARVVRVDQ